MKLFRQIIALLLACAFITGCAPKTEVGNNRSDSDTSATVSASAAVAETNALNTETSLITVGEPVMPEFSGLDDTALVSYLEDSIYSQLVSALNSADYFVENVSAAYVSKEYLEEIAYNSQENIYFGYTLSEIDEQFQGTRFIFTLGDDGKTEVREFQKYDDTYDKIIRNVIIGSGVILLCVTVSVASGGLGAPAVSMIFAASAKSGAIIGLSSGLFSGVTAGVIKGIETHDMNEAVKAAAFAGSESLKWGAISGAVSGGLAHGNKTPFTTGNSGTSIAHLPPPFVNGSGTLFCNLGDLIKWGDLSREKNNAGQLHAARHCFFHYSSPSVSSFTSLVRVAT